MYGGGYMPKDTFFNLSGEKKKRIIDAAVEEFSTRRFSEASLNQIVKTAKIPWGSFYQYFEDKEDIFNYMYGEILKEKREIISHSVTITPEMDVFEACLKTIKATFEWSKLKPEYSRIGMLMDLDDSEFITRLRMDSAKGLRDMVERDKSRGFIRPEIDSDLVVDIIYALILKEYSWAGMDERVFTKRLNDVIEIVRKGLR